MPFRKIANKIRAVTEVMASSTSRQTVNDPLTSASSKRNNFVYPLQAKGKDTDWLQIRGFEYLPEGESGNRIIDTKYHEEGPMAGGIKEITVNPVSRYSSRFNPAKQAKLNIQLPIPEGVSDTNATSWGEDTLNPVQSAMIGAGMGVLSSPTNPLSTVQSMLKQAQEGTLGTEGMSTEDKDMLMTYLSAQAANIAGGNVNAQNIIKRATGKIIQSNLELLFENVMLRQFNFSWNFSPRSADEAQEVKWILRKLKQGMSAQDGSPTSDVGTGSTGWFIGSPYVWQLDYKKGPDSHPFLNKFKPCALTSVSVNYSGAGMYASYGDGTPVHMTMSCNFKEINPVYHQDYDHDSAGQGVGY